MQRRKTDTGDVAPTDAVRVLIVDDDEPYRLFLRTLVRRLGCSVVTAADGTEALQQLTESDFDFLLSDLEMPRLNGLDLITHVRRHATAADIYAVMITSREDVQSKHAALSLGFDDFLPKSCADVELKARVATARRMVARQQASDAEAARWRLLATRDELTNVGTRRAFTERAREHLLEERAVAVVMFDLDDFKHINDTYGHLAGDRILRDVGAMFLARTRREDVIARYGGDEFVLLVADASLEEATIIAERLVHDVAQLSWLVGTDTIRISSTIGIAHSTLLANPDVDRLLAVADGDLYAKKFLRRNPPVAPPELYDYSRPDASGPDSAASAPASSIAPASSVTDLALRQKGKGPSRSSSA
jgi:two-component system, cell cycle response regulator